MPNSIFVVSVIMYGLSFGLPLLALGGLSLILISLFFLVLTIALTAGGFDGPGAWLAMEVMRNTVLTFGLGVLTRLVLFTQPKTGAFIQKFAIILAGIAVPISLFLVYPA